MMEVIVFAVTLVASQILGGFIMMKLLMNPKFVKKFMKDYFELIEELAEEMDV